MCPSSLLETRGINIETEKDEVCKCWDMFERKLNRGFLLTVKRTGADYSNMSLATFRVMLVSRVA